MRPRVSVIAASPGVAVWRAEDKEPPVLRRNDTDDPAAVRTSWRRLARPLLRVPCHEGITSDPTP
jgi:hypothetical protein